MKETNEHAIIILSDVEEDILDALMTYMYQGEVFLPQSRLDTFLKVAAGLEIKGISESPDFLMSSSESIYHPATTFSTSGNHPIGDLSLLAAAATSSMEPEGGSISKRRKTAPRKLDIPTGYRVPKVEFHNDENSSPLAMNLSTKPAHLPAHQSGGLSATQSPYIARAGLLNIPNPINFTSLKSPTKIDLPSSPVALDMSQTRMQKGSTTALRDIDATSPHSEEETTKPGDQGGSQETNMAPVTEATTPEQMDALLGPAWKSRQPRLCQYCQRMFSNKFNLKQV